MFDHVSIEVTDIQRSKDFYVKAFLPLGYVIHVENEEYVGFGTLDRPHFWLNVGDAKSEVHIAFPAKDRGTVDAFYEAAIAAGGVDDGKPGLRPEYHENYYGAFVLDPDGNSVEAVCHKAPPKGHEMPDPNENPQISKGTPWVMSCTENYEKTVEFFRDVIGFPLAEEGIPTTDRQFTRYAQFKAPDGMILEIVEPDEKVRGLYKGPIPSITIQDVDQARSRMEAHGIEFVAPVLRTKEGLGWTYFRAPDGNIYQIQGTCRQGEAG